MSQDGVSSPSTDSTLPNTLRRRVRLPVFRATGGDHAAINCFLQSVFHGPPPAEFQASLDDPFYEPRDRLLLRQRRQIVAHVQIAHRTMLFGPARIPVASLGWLGVASEHRGRGLGTHLLREAERQMRMDGALLGMLRTSIPRFFRPQRLGDLRTDELSARQRLRHPRPALGSRPDPPPPATLAHPAVVAVGTSGVGANLRRFRPPTARWNAPTPTGIGC